MSGRTRNLWTRNFGRWELTLNDRLPYADGPRVMLTTTLSVEYGLKEEGGGFHIRWWGHRSVHLCVYAPLAYLLAEAIATWQTHRKDWDSIRPE